MMKKLSAVLLTVLLALTGCSSNALLVGNSIKNTMDLSSYEAKTVLQLSGHLSAGPMDEKEKLVFDILKDGIMIDTLQKNKQESHVTISAKKPAPILGSELWPYQTAPSFDLFTKGNDLLFKSSIDKKFLAMSAGTETGTVPDSALSEKMNQFMKDFISQYDYNFQHLEKVGQEQITLPNGSVSDTTHMKLTLDMQEALDLAAYTLDNLSCFEGLTDVAALAPIPNETQQEMDLTEIRKSLSDMAQQIKSMKTEELKASGFDAKLSVQLWIDKDQQIVQNESNIYFKLPNDITQQGNSSEQTDVNLTLWSQNWNHNKNLSIQYPNKENIVNAEEMKKDATLLKSFDPSSPNRFLAKTELLMGAQPFDDVPSYDWAYEPVTMLHQMDIINGYENNEFKPERNISRAEFITMAANALHLESASANTTFKDNNQIPAWANPSVQAAVQSGLLDGYEDGTLRPNQPISRAEIVTILVKGFHLPLSTSYSLQYTDRNAIPTWAVNYVRTAASEGLVDGYEDGRFVPNNPAKRSEVASIIYKSMMKS